MPQLFFTNLPYNCSDQELTDWMESRGIKTKSTRIIRDLVAGVSPAFAYADLNDAVQLEEAVAVLNGERMRNQVIMVTQASESRLMRSKPATASERS